MSDDGKTNRSESQRRIWASLAVWLIDALVSGTQKNDPEDKYRASQDRSSRRTAYATLAMAAFTLAIFVLGIFQYVVFNRQLAVMQRQLNDAEIQEAASITIQNLVVAGFPDENILSYDILNTGRTRADQVTVGPGYMWVNSDEKLTPQQQKFTILHQISQNPNGLGGRAAPSEMGITIDPKDPPLHVSVRMGPEPPTFSDVPPEELAKMKLPSRNDLLSGRTISFFYVTGIYKDVFGHILHVVNCIAFTGGPSWEGCEGQQNRHY